MCLVGRFLFKKLLIFLRGFWFASETTRFLFSVTANCIDYLIEGLTNVMVKQNTIDETFLDGFISHLNNSIFFVMASLFTF